MTSSISKWSFLRRHALASCRGLARFFVKRPGLTLRLLAARGRYFLTRKFTGPLDAGDGFTIETDRELIAYWSFFVENECWSAQWAGEIEGVDKPLILDVGANAGLFSYWIWRIKPNAQFILFEPLPRMAAKIQDWITRTGADAKVIRTAVSDQCGVASFFLSSDNDTTASLKPEDPKISNIEVPLTTLDAVIEDRPIFLIKIDVEGCEPEVLAGGKRTIGQAAHLIIEAHTPAALAAISAKLDKQWEHTQVGASDHLFSRKDKSATRRTIP